MERIITFYKRHIGPNPTRSSLWGHLHGVEGRISGSQFIVIIHYSFIIFTQDTETRKKIGRVYDRW